MLPWSRKMFPGTNLQDLNLDWILRKFAALRGGTTGQYLYKKSNNDFDFGWKTGGGGGGSSDYLDLDNKPSINNVELIGNKTATDLGLAAASDIPAVPVQSVNGQTGDVNLTAADVGAGTYSKPSGGIPKSDLASAVRTSLGKADSALQAVPSTYRTAAAQDAIDAVYSAYKRTHCNLVCFGDSWTVGTGIAEADRPTKRFTAIVANKLDCTEFNFGVGAAGFIRSGNLFSTQINTANSQMTSGQKANTGIVLIVGGVNDYRQQLSASTQAQFVAGVVSTVNLAHTVFPNALIVVGIGNTNLSYFPEKARQWYSAAISACEQLDFPALIIKNLYNVISGNTSRYASDNLHPNESGHGAFGGYIANAILGGGQSVFSALGTVTLTSGVSLDGTEGPTELTLWRVNDEVVIGAARFTFSPAVTNAKIIGTIPAKSAPPSNAYYPFYNSDQHAGNIAITAGGNVYLIPATGITSLASGFNQQVRYMFGKPTNGDEG